MTRFSFTRVFRSGERPARVRHVGGVMSSRRRPIGAEAGREGVHFRVWAPNASRVSVVLDSERSEHVLQREEHGYFSGLIEELTAGARYRFRIDGEREPFPDPASRFQPDGVFGPSEVIDPASYRWRDASWRGATLQGLVISEVHVGTLTAEGTFAAAVACLDRLAGAGINCVELMPVSEFPGHFGWGYDGVDLWAPTHLYGRPDDFRRFVDEAHARDIAVILDVVYNHLGPSGCFLSKFAKHYFTDRYRTDWGPAINFDGDHAREVREFFVENAAYWIDEFHLDGLRLDATQSIKDTSRPHVIREIAGAARRAARDRPILIIAENEPQDVAIVREHGADAMWNDDWHHASRVALTGHTEAYYSDYRGKPQEFVSMAKFGFLYQGQRYRWQKKRRGTPSVQLEPPHLILYLQNHDQIANSARGERIHQLAARGEVRALTALLLLSPQTPMLFQGQEFAASAPFLYFADHEPELAAKVAEGRREFLRQFRSLATEEVRESIALPHDPATFERCKLDWDERERHPETLALHRDLITLRRTDPAFAAQRSDVLAGSVIGEGTFGLRWYLDGADDRLLIVNLTRDFRVDPVPEPILAPPAGSAGWKLLWSSEDPAYGGHGTPPVETDDGWNIPAQAAVVLQPK